MASGFQKTLVETFYEHYDSGLNTLQYHILDHIVEYLLVFGTSALLDGSPYEHFSMHIKQAYKRILRRRRTKFMEKAGVIERSYEQKLYYGKK